MTKAIVRCISVTQLPIADAGVKDANCTWNSVTKDCGLKNSKMFQMLAKGDDTKKDELCSFMSVMSQGNCDQHTDKKSCLADEQCSYDDDGASLFAHSNVSWFL